MTALSSLTPLVGVLGDASLLMEVIKQSVSLMLEPLLELVLVLLVLLVLPPFGAYGHVLVVVSVLSARPMVDVPAAARMLKVTRATRRLTRMGLPLSMSSQYRALYRATRSVRLPG